MTGHSEAFNNFLQDNELLCYQYLKIQKCIHNLGKTMWSCISFCCSRQKNICSREPVLPQASILHNSSYLISCCFMWGLKLGNNFSQDVTKFWWFAAKKAKSLRAKNTDSWN